MCSRLLQKMENFQGDLTDMLLARSTHTTNFAPPAAEDELVSSAAGGSGAVEWQFSGNNNNNHNSKGGFLQMVDDFGDPFSNMRDPLFLNIPSSDFFAGSTTAVTATTATTSPSSETIMTSQQQPCNNNNKNNNNNIFPTTTKNMIQISMDSVKLPVSPRPVIGSPLVGSTTTNDHHLISCSNNNSGMNHSKGSMVENGGAQQQISSPRNTGLKRRKTQAKKVVCIPAPSPANSRPSSGEMVPSDLWAWRKYGQKPIKGSPYPRGYYRCSSSKGCSARKQVERSRTDPNMLVITYTSEHNHPWPTQRNALAGSTRNQPTTTTAKTTTTTTGSTSKPSNQSQKTTANAKEEFQKESALDHNQSSAPNSSKRPAVVKEEIDYTHNHHHDSNKRIKVDHHQQQYQDQEVQFDEGFQQTYRPSLPDHQLNHHNHSEDFFADLGELEADGPLNLLFTQGYSGDEEPENKSLDPFSFYDWVNSNTATTTTATTTATVTASVEEVNKGLL
ncbi:OLC1v1024127C1 [Oldenlandia corymbosa var. corymbosa]|uniref:OLC1v1024127C1 n=1 Tax=Oldenlandia corymbosa var. corymbosa TaxID=529605 RepID=A0AAV1C1J9_OLDCO|nr:OLC1v1024127C1 [Oldenlandia corymbosa var. corymbosa]